MIKTKMMKKFFEEGNKKKKRNDTTMKNKFYMYTHVVTQVVKWNKVKGKLASNFVFHFANPSGL